MDNKKIIDIAKEVVGARETYSSLKERLDDFDLQLDTKANEMNNLLNNKVDKVAGKDLSTNNYTNEEKLLVGQINDKRDKTTTIKMADLDQEVKDAMTGGSVAVVGVNAVGTSNIINNSVTFDKMASDSIGNANLRPTADVQLRVEFTTGGYIKSFINDDKSATITIKNLIVEMLKKNLIRHTSVIIGATETTYILPNHSRLVWRYTNADGTFGHTIEVLNKDSSCINMDNVILLQNSDGVLYGKLSEFTYKNGMYLLPKSVSNSSVDWTIAKSFKANNVFKTSYDETTGDVTLIVPSAGLGIYCYENDGSVAKAISIEANKTFTIPYLGSLVLNTLTDEISVLKNLEKKDDNNYIHLIFNHKWGILSGVLSDICLNNITGNRILDNTISIDKLDDSLKEKINNNNSSSQIINYFNGGLPDYWLSYIDEKVSEIKLIENKDINSFSFAFTSDNHFDEHSPKLTGEILYNIDNGLDLSKVLFGGDYISYSDAKEEMFKRMVNFTNNIGKVKHKSILSTGNHEIIYKYDSSTLQPILYASKMESRTLRKQFDSNIKYDGENLYCYVDDDKNKIRYISIDMYDKITNHVQVIGMTQEQIDWLCNSALMVDDDEWKIVIIGHQPLYLMGVAKMPPMKNANILIDIMDSYNAKNTCVSSCSHPDFITSVDYDFSNSKGKILAFLCGHGHEDCHTFTPNGIPVIEITSDNYVPRGIGDVSKTTDEHSFDIYTVVPNERKVYITKIGGLGTFGDTPARITEFNY